METIEIKHSNKTIVFSKGLNEYIDGCLKININDINNDLANYTNFNLYEYSDFKKIYVRPYFDIDIKIDNDKTINDRYINDTLYIIIDTIKIFFDVSDNDIAVCSDIRKNKVSFHINLINYYTTIYDLNNWGKKNKDLLLDNNFDLAVYSCSDNKETAYHKWRTLYSKKYKMDENGKKIYESDNGFVKFSLSNSDLNILTHNNLDYLITYTNSKMKCWKHTRYDDNISNNAKIKMDVSYNDVILNEMCSLLDLIPGSKVNSYTDTIKFIWSCCSTKNKEIIEKCREVCKRNPKYYENELWFDTIVDNYDDKNIITIGTALKLAKESNPDEYIKIKNSSKYNGIEIDKNTFTDEVLAEYFCKLYGHLFISKNNMLYCFNGNIWITEDSKFILSKLISTDFYNSLLDIIKLKYDINDKNYDFFISKLNILKMNKKKEGIITEIITILKDKDTSKIIFDVNKDDKYIINFKNGILDTSKLIVDSNNNITNLKEVFRKRTNLDYFTMYLPYDFIINKDELFCKNKTGETIDIIEDICNIYKKINKTNDLYNATLDWYAYNLIGETDEQLFMCNIGYSASNGKSTESKIHNECASIYSKDFNRETFNIDYQKSHKQLIYLKYYPLRHVYIEELGRSNLNTDLMKVFVDGNNINVEIMFGTNESLPNQSKLNLISNYDLNFKQSDNGLDRRGLYKKFDQRFVSENDYNRSINKTNLHIKDTTLLNKFKNDLYKNAYIHILLPRIVNIINYGLNLPDFLKDGFKEISSEYNSFKNAFDDLFIITDEPKDFIGKDLFLDKINTKYNKKIDWKKCLSEVKSMGLTYDKNKMYNYKRGCILGLQSIDKEVILSDDE